MGATYWGPHDYAEWCAHLEALATRRGASVAWTRLPITGRDRVMIVNASVRREPEGRPRPDATHNDNRRGGGPRR